MLAALVTAVRFSKLPTSSDRTVDVGLPLECGGHGTCRSPLGPSLGRAVFVEIEGRGRGVDVVAATAASGADVELLRVGPIIDDDVGLVDRRSLRSADGGVVVNGDVASGDVFGRQSVAMSVARLVTYSSLGCRH